MGDFIDLLKKAETDPEEFKKITSEGTKLAEYNLTSAELEVVKKMDPQALKTIASRIKKRELASSQACQACADRQLL